MIFDTPYNLSLLAELGQASTFQPRISQIITALYDNMFSLIADQELEQASANIKTRIATKDHRGIWKGKIFKSHHISSTSNLPKS